MTEGTNPIRLVGERGFEADILPFGATLRALRVPDRHGRVADIVLGHNDETGYRARRNFFGATIGRFGNRIAQGKFPLDGKVYTLAVNNGPNALHGGLKGFDAVPWSVLDQDRRSVRLGYVSPDGEEGYPGTLEAALTYRIEGNALVLDYEARTDRPTVVNLTHHSFFNLSGAESATGILDHVLTVAAEHYLPVDGTAIPLGHEAPVEGTPFDFRTATPLRARVLHMADPQIAVGGGIDHTFCLGGTVPEARFAARVHDPRSGRVMDVLTTEPGVQIYTGNFLDGSVLGKSGKRYGRNHALCLECQHYPDSPNRPEFPSVRLDPGTVYRQKTVYAFSSEEIARNDP
jgi:aldose 1-epimerase